MLDSDGNLVLLFDGRSYKALYIDRLYSCSELYEL